MQVRQQGMYNPVAPIFESQLPIKITFFLKDKRRDAADMIKTLLDVCTGILWDDDKWICVQMVHPLLIDKKSPRVELEFLCL